MRADLILQGVQFRLTLQKFFVGKIVDEIFHMFEHVIETVGEVSDFVVALDFGAHRQIALPDGLHDLREIFNRLIEFCAQDVN